MIVDCHTHVADAATAGPPGVGRDWWSSGEAGVDHLLTDLNAAGVERAVVVQAVGPHGYDCAYAAHAVARAPDRLALVVAVDLAGPEPDLSTLPPAAGVRLFGVAGEPTWLDDGRAAAVWAAAARARLTLVPTLFRHDLGRLRPLLEARPDVPVALDHCGFPDGDLEPVLALADLPSLHLKVSSHVLAAEADPGALVARLAGAYGADRLCWGSDHPQHGGSYRDLVDLGRRAAAGLDASGRARFLSGTANRLWFGEG